MKILTWNINGIRSIKQPVKYVLDNLSADVICIQETKITRDQLDSLTATVDGYNAYFSFSRKKSGYSGVATYCKDHVMPVKAEEGLSGRLTSDKTDDGIGCYGDLSDFTDDELTALDAEGRTIITQHKIRHVDGSETDLTIINVYCPRADPEREDRKLYKLRFYALLQTRAEALIRDGSHVIVLGDINATHTRLDLCDPDEEEYSRGAPARLWLNQMIWETGRDRTIDTPAGDYPGTTSHTTGGMFVDSFRHLYPLRKDAFTNWCMLTGARQTNYGRRLDYILSDIELSKTLTDTLIMADVEGSDHCPVLSEYQTSLVGAIRCPPLCTRFMPEFSGKQQKLSDMFGRTSSQNGVKLKHLSHDADCVIGIQASGQNLKRKLTTDTSMSQPKKSKTVNKSKQNSLTSFFKKTGPDIKLDACNVKKSEQSDDKFVQDSLTKPDMLQKDITPVPKVVNKELIGAWKAILGGPGPAPLCKGHKEPCLLRIVKKDGPNKGKQFFVCRRPEGLASNPESRCDFFKWVEKTKR